VSFDFSVFSAIFSGIDRNNVMKKILYFFIVLILVAAGFWGYKYYLSHQTIGQPPQQQSSSINIYATNDHIHSHEIDKFLTFIQQKSPSGIIILVDKNETTAQDICGNEKRHHKIVITYKSNPHIKRLKRWDINPQKIYPPYTVIIREGNIIIQSSGIICTY
jgi:hypothetical protein